MLRRLPLLTQTILIIFCLIIGGLSYYSPWAGWMNAVPIGKWPALIQFPFAFAFGCPLYLHAYLNNDGTEEQNLFAGRIVGGVSALVAGTGGWAVGYTMVEFENFNALRALHAGLNSAAVYMLVFTAAQLWLHGKPAFRSRPR